AIVNAYHPGQYLPRKSTTFLLRDGVTEAEGKGWEDKRPLVKKLLDPFDFGGTVRLIAARRKGGTGGAQSTGDVDEWELARRGTGNMERGATATPAAALAGEQKK